MISVGTDIQEVNDFKEKSYDANKNFYKKIFSKREIEYCLKKEDPYQSFTCRFCAKEAVVKAIGTVKVKSLADIEIVMKEHEPKLFINEKELKNASVSMSHTKSMAIATVILY